MDTKSNRFKRYPNGGQFAETFYNGSTFKTHTHSALKPEPQLDQTDLEGRPLWLNEINKNVPAGATYNIESVFGAKSTLLKTRQTAFLSNQAEINQPL